MKAVALFGLVVAVTAASGSAAADAPPPATPRYTQLPSGTPTFVPTKGMPLSVPRGAPVPGLFFDKTNSGNPNVVDISGIAVRPDDRPMTGEETRTCFAETGSDAIGSARGGSEETPVDWSESGLAAEAQLYRRSSDFPQGGVSAVHVERFEEKNGTPTLEMTDAWVDPGTHGARVFARRGVPLALVATSAWGVRVFAMRDDRPKEKLVQFVLVPDDKQRFDGQGSMMGIASDGHRMAHSECGHLRMALPVTDEGASAQLFTSVIVGDAKPDPNVALSGASEVRSKRRHGADAGEHRFRPLSVQVSVSRTSRDPEPLVSVSFGWAARESRERSL